MKVFFAVCAILFVCVFSLYAQAKPAMSKARGDKVSKNITRNSNQRIPDRRYFIEGMIGRGTGPGLRLSLEDPNSLASKRTNETGLFASYWYMPKVGSRGAHLAFVGVDQTLWYRAANMDEFTLHLGIRGSFSLGYFHLTGSVRDIMTVVDALPVLRFPIIPKVWFVTIGPVGLRAGYTVLAKFQTNHTWQFGTSLEF